MKAIRQWGRSACSHGIADHRPARLTSSPGLGDARSDRLARLRPRAAREPGQHPPLRPEGHRRDRDARTRPAGARPLRRRRPRGLVGAAIHRDELDHRPRRRGLRPLLRRHLLVQAVRRPSRRRGRRRSLRRHAVPAGARAMIDVAPVLGVLAGLVGLADTVPYVRDILRGTTRPHRGTWLIWGILAIVAFYSQRADGATWSLVMVAAQAILTTLVLLLAVRRGVGGMSLVEAGKLVVAPCGVPRGVLPHPAPPPTPLGPAPPRARRPPCIPPNPPGPQPPAPR